MALTARPVFCELKPQTQKAEPAVFTPVQKLRVSEPGQLENGKIMLQPRLTTLRSFGSDPVGVIKTKNGFHGEDDEVSPFFATLSEYIESSKKSQDFEIISGRLAMVINFSLFSGCDWFLYSVSKHMVQTDQDFNFNWTLKSRCIFFHLENLRSGSITQN